MLRALFLKLPMLFITLYLPACSLLGDRLLKQSDLARQIDSTLADLPAASGHLNELRTQAVDGHSETTEENLLLDVSAAYQEALLLADKPQVKQEIQQRLAHIHLQLAEERQVNDATLKPKDVYKEAIVSYLALLEYYEQQNSLASFSTEQALLQHAPIDQILYPLAKAYEMSGDIPKALAMFNRLVIEAPNSIYYSEAQFRRAEILFAAADYAPASHAYKSVIESSTNQFQGRPDNSINFLMNSWYMLGWSDFKLGRYRSALKAFLTVLDNHYQLDIDNGSFIEQEFSSRQALTNDTLRVMSLAFSYEAGAITIADLLDTFYLGTAEPEYVDKLYQNLANLYLEKKRFIDCANTFAAYINRYPDSAKAPYFHKQIIDVYAAGIFPKRVREHKQQYVQAYGRHSDFWAVASDDSRLEIQSNISLYINELASYYHHLAQSQQQLRKKQLSNIEQQTANDLKSTRDRLISEKEIQRLFNQAGDWYEAWIVNSPLSAEVDSIWFLLGETRYESQRYELAIKAFENAAYGSLAYQEGREDVATSNDASNPNASASFFSQHNEAAYAALLAYDQLIAGHQANTSVIDKDMPLLGGLDQEQQSEQWQIAKNRSALLFANTFPDDQRSNTVLAQALESLFMLKQFDDTIVVGRQLIGRLDNNSKEDSNVNVADKQKFKLIAYLSIAHAQRELLQFDQSENAYAEALSVLNNDIGGTLYQQYYAATLDNYAASIYQQGLLQTEVDQPELAASNFMRVVELAPSSSVRLSAQRDAISLFLQTQQWQQAIAVMLDFQQQFVADPAATAIPAQLLLAYESLEDWPAAAAQAKAISVNDDNPTIRQQALYSAAEFYYLAGDIENAIDCYRSYAHNYTLPLADNMEAQYRLTEIYAEIEALEKRAYWLRKLMRTHDHAQSPTNRSRYLAAFSAVALAETKLLTYQSLLLVHPLKASMENKRKAMKVALDAYDKAQSYDLELFSTQATYRIAGIYAELASALLASERPAGLSALELEQYGYLLEEQAYPFEEKAIDFYKINVERSWQGIDSEWVRSSYQALAELIPAKYGKREMLPGLMK